MGYFVRLTVAAVRGHEGDTPTAQLTGWRRAMYTAGALAVLCFGLGLVSLTPALWGAALLLAFPVVPVLAFLDYRTRVRRGILTETARRAMRESVIAWTLLLVLGAAGIAAASFFAGR